MPSKILTEVVFAGSGTGSSVNTALFRLLARPRKKILIATLIVVPVLLGLVAALSIVVISCHLGGAGLVLATFRPPVSGLVIKACKVLDFLFRVLVTMSNRFALFKLQNLHFVAPSPNDLLL